jgi:hypothetical protein
MRKLVFFSVLIFQLASGYSQEINYISEPQLSEVLDSNSNAKVYINDSLSYLYNRPRPFSFIYHSIQDLYLVPKVIVKKESLVPVIGVAASSALLIAFDEDITRVAKRFGRFVNLSSESHDRNISPIKGLDFWIPLDLSTGLYYIGDGMTEMAVNGGFYVYGLIAKDPRARQTASQLSEGMIATGIYVQIFKHLTGRTTARKSGGKDIWRPFPSLKEYYSSVPKYDAFYSGHLTVAMMTTTVIALNYPEKKFVRPLCYSLMALCGYQMINNGVHWAGDYPMAIGMGYVIAKIAVARGRTQVIVDPNKQIKLNAGVVFPEYHFKPAFLDYGATGMRFTMTF